MSGRGRALAFAAGAIACAALAAAAASGGDGTAVAGAGELRPVLVAAAALQPGSEIEPRTARRALEVRRVPAAFAPPDALLAPDEAIGRRLATPLVPGAYVTMSAFRTRAEGDGRGGAPPGTSPVEIVVTGAGALAGAARRARVDVVVSGEPGPGPARGQTYVAARRVALLALRRTRRSGGITPGDSYVATLALRRREALRLIRAEGVARSIRLLRR